MKPRPVAGGEKRKLQKTGPKSLGDVGLQKEPWGGGGVAVSKIPNNSGEKIRHERKGEAARRGKRTGKNWGDVRCRQSRRFEQMRNNGGTKTKGTSKIS